MIIPLQFAKKQELVGNKAFSLFELQQVSKKLVRGFIISHDTSDWKEVDNFIRKNVSRKKLYAVRSSSNVEDSSKSSYAGLFETELGVSKEQLLESIKRVMKSSQTKRVKEFAQTIGQKYQDINVSVLVQEMIPSEVSGICFTNNPQNGRRSEIFIEAGIGLGEYVVSDQITPDKYIVRKKDYTIVQVKTHAQHEALFLEEEVVRKDIFHYKQKLSVNQIKELSCEAKNIEEFFGYACDIEWAFAKGKLYILQVRPIAFSKNKTKRKK